jgi:hypothetical protein
MRPVALESGSWGAALCSQLSKRSIMIIYGELLTTTCTFWKSCLSSLLADCFLSARRNPRARCDGEIGVDQALVLRTAYEGCRCSTRVVATPPGMIAARL